MTIFKGWKLDSTAMVGGEMTNLRTGLKLAMSNEQGVSPIQLALKFYTKFCILGFFPTCRGGGGLQVSSGGELPPFADCQP